MALPASHLSLEDYDQLYGHEPGWEYWFGQARLKPSPTFLHGLLSMLLGELLRRAGYFSSVEADLHLTPDWSPRPDACGVLTPVEGKYPNAPVDVVFEVLSEAEDVLDKCRRYSQAGVRQIFVFDPVRKTVTEWAGTALIPVIDVILANGITITGRTIWSEMERRSKERQDPPASGII